MAKIKNKLAYLLALVIPTFGFAQDADEPKSAGSEEKAAESASGSLSAGAIAAAVAAAAAIAAAVDSGDGGGAAPAPTPAPTEVYEYTTDVTVASATTTSSATQSQTASQTSINSATQTNVASAASVNSNTSSSTSTVTLTMTDTDPSDGMFNNPTVATEAIITELDSGNAGYDVVVAVDAEVINPEGTVDVQREILTHEDRATTIEIETTVDVVEQVTATATRKVQ